MSQPNRPLAPVVVTVEAIIEFHRKFRNAMRDAAEQKHPVLIRKEAMSSIRNLCRQDDENGVSALKKVVAHQTGACAVVAGLAQSVAEIEDAAERHRYQDALADFCDVACEGLESEELQLSSAVASMTVSGSSDGDATATTPIDAGALLQELMTSDQLPALEVMIELCKAGRTVFAKEEPLLTVTAPCVVVGDIHGQLRDLQHNILRIAGDLGKVPLLFLGDFVDRGASSLHCMAILICAKILHPDKVFLIRGNHESRMTNSVYGFLTECHSKYPVEMTENTPPATINIFFAQPTHPLWAEMNRVFDALPLAAIIGDRIFCVHGGLSPRARSIDTIIAMNRFCDIDQGVMSDLTWSDPFCATGFQYNHRGCGQLFGEDVSAEFLEKNNLLFVCRAHQCVRDGYCWAHNNQVLTLFSAPNYCGQGNLGAVMLVDDNLQHSFATYSSYVPPPPAEEGLPLAASPPSNVSVSSSALTDSSSPAAEAPAETPAAAPDKTLPPYF